MLEYTAFLQLLQSGINARREIRSDVRRIAILGTHAGRGQALIYFVADGHLTSPFGVDGKWVGAVNGGRYFIVAIDPSEHHICAMLQSFLPLRGPKVSVHSLKAESGGSYYFRTRMVGISSGFVLQLDQLDSDEGRRFVAWSKFSTSHPKD